MKVLYINEKEEFITIKLKDFCNLKRITIKYVASYMLKKNNIAKQKQKKIVIKKNYLLINNGLFLEFWTKMTDISKYL